MKTCSNDPLTMSEQELSAWWEHEFDNKVIEGSDNHGKRMSYAPRQEAVIRANAKYIFDRIAKI